MSEIAANKSPEIAENGPRGLAESNWISLLALRVGLFAMIFVGVLNWAALRAGLRLDNGDPVSALRNIEFAMYGMSAVFVVATYWVFQLPSRGVSNARWQLRDTGLFVTVLGVVLPLAIVIGIEGGIRVGGDPLAWFDFQQTTQDVAWKFVILPCLLVAGLGFYLRRRRSRAVGSVDSADT